MYTVDRRGYSHRLRGLDAVLRRVPQPDLSARGLLAHAERAAGRTDARPGEIEPALRAIAADLDERSTTALGRRFVHASLTTALRNRLIRQDLPTDRPTRPIVLVGWYRSGTSFLHNLLAALPGYGAAPLAAFVAPGGRTGDRARVRAGTTAFGALMPEMRRLHPVHARRPEECWLVLSAHLVVDAWAQHWDLPRYAAWLETVDRRPAYASWATAMGALERDRGHRLVLKDPHHLRALDVLREVVPDARLVWTHRDPADCVASYASLCAVHRRAVYGTFDPAQVGRAALKRWSDDHHRARRARSQWPADQVVDVSFDALVSDPIATARTVCAELDLPFDAAAIAARARTLRTERAAHRTELAQWSLSRAEPELR